MTPRPATHPTASDRRPGVAEGFTLLEVLVAGGVLVVALASIAAMLPAAAIRLQEAAATDRGGAMAAAALAEFECRDLACREVFLEVSGTYMPANRAVVFGQVLPSVWGTYSNTANPIVSLAGTGASQLAGRIDTTSGASGRGFFLEDELQYRPGFSVLNMFTNGARDFRRGTCWGAMLEPYPWGSDPSGMSAPPMRAVRATIAVFRKPGEVKRMRLSGSAGGVFVIAGVTASASAPSDTYLSDDSERRRFLAPCAPVLAVALSGSAAPQWLTINSSWSQGTPPATHGVVFRERGSVYASLISGGVLQVIGFENIQSITQQTYTID